MSCLKIVCFLFICCRFSVGEKNNVCSTYADYFFIDTSPNCWYNPDVDADIFQIMARRNITIETYNVVSEDGYILTMYRLPRPNPKGVIFLVHPMSQTSVVWFSDVENSLGFLLYQDGYEIWLPNTRGTYYSSSHTNFSANEYRYWNFTFHELGFYDIPVELDLVQNITKRSDIIFIGYSLPTTAAMVYASLLPEHAKKAVKLFILIAPVIYTNPTPLKSRYIPFNFTQVANFLEFFGSGTLTFSFEGTHNFLKSICTSQFRILCTLVVEGADGIRNYDPVKAAFVFSKMYARLALKVIRHYIQIRDTGRFAQYSYGEKGNLMLYNSVEPPLYPINNIKVPVYLIYGGKDRFATLAEIEKFYGQLPSEAKIYGKHLVPEFNHLDFVFAKQYKEKVIDEVFKVIKKVK